MIAPRPATLNPETWMNSLHWRLYNRTAPAMSSQQSETLGEERNFWHEKTRHRAGLNMAEREGFEPSMEFDPHTPLAGERLRPLGHLSAVVLAFRSEEHTSELQSRVHLVCRLLLEEKNQR